MSGGNDRALPRGHGLGSFELRAVLGAGGFGITYRAMDLNLNRPVAIKEYFPAEFARRASDGKTVKPRFGRLAAVYRQGLEIFQDEARMLAKFRHPSIVRVSQLLTSSNTAYTVMDYEPGDTLHTVTRRCEHLSSLRIGQIAQDVLSGLIAVHGQGITHRDITPGNIILREEGTAVLIDFGAARTMWDGEFKSDPIAAYTPSYAAPEVAFSNGTGGPSTDLYSLGAVLFHCMSGAPPPSADKRRKLARNAEKSSGQVDHVLDKMRSERPESLVETVRWMLRLSPDQRPQNAEEVLRALNQPDAAFVRSKQRSSKRTARNKPSTTRKREHRRRTTSSKGRAPVPVSAEVLNLFKRRVERICPSISDYLCDAASSGSNEEQLLDCLAGLRANTKDCLTLIETARAHTVESASEPQRQAAMLRCLQSLAAAGRAVGQRTPNDRIM